MIFGSQATDFSQWWLTHCHPVGPSEGVETDHRNDPVKDPGAAKEGLGQRDSHEAVV